MIFSTVFFLFVFLPLSLIIYYVVPKKFRSIPLILISLLFYAWGEPRYLILLAASLVFNYASALEIAQFKAQENAKMAKITMIIAVTVNLLILGFFKYFGFLVGNISALTGLNLSAPHLSLPLGLSFYTFTVLSYVLDVYLGRAEAQKNPLHYAVYVTFFPKLISGPIVQYKDMAPQLEADRPMDLPKFGAGVNLFLVGLFKKVLISDNLGTVFGALSGMTAMSAGTAWLGMILYSLQLYFDFSGYSDMAIGLAGMFGFKFEKNFDYPYLSSSIPEFWRRWHISLGAWFRDYLYIPMGGNRCSRNRQLLNLSVVWLLTGLWHGANWNFIFWGVYHGLLVMLDRFLLKDRWKALPSPLRIFLTTLAAFFGWVMFFSPSMGAALHWYGQMFGGGGLGLFDSTFRYYFSSCLPLLIIAILGCGPLAQRVHQALAYRRGGLVTYVSAAAYILLLVMTVASLINSTYTSFLYFQF